MTVKASFTDEVKAELANVQPARPCCQEAELTAMAEALAGAGDGAPLTLRIPRNAVARKVIHLARVAGGRVETVRKGATEKRPSYRLRLTLPSGRGSADACCARAILRGTFLARGVLGNPADAYHLEMAVPTGATSLLSSGAAAAGVALKRTARRGRASPGAPTRRPARTRPGGPDQQVGSRQSPASAGGAGESKWSNRLSAGTPAIIPSSEERHAGEGWHQRVRPHRAQCLPRRPGPARPRDRRGQRHHGSWDPGPPPQVRLDPRQLRRCGRSRR